MRSLLHQTTLTIIAVLVLISCATQTQAIGVSIDENSDPNLYARNHIDAVATRKGLSNVQWLGGKSGASSFARLMYGGEPAFMTCMAGDRDRAAFEALVNARTTLKGANEEYRNYVKYPLTSVQVPALQSQPAGNCFIYRYIGGPALWPFIFSKGNYVDKLITFNQVMPQLLKGSIYLFNAGITNIKLNLDQARVELQPNSRLKATIFGFDVKERSRSLPQQLGINTPTVTSNPGSPNPYTCYGYHRELLEYITDHVNLRIVANPQNVTPEDRMEIAAYINKRARSMLAQDSTGKKLENAVAAFISLLQVYAILEQVKDCTALVAALESMSAPVPQKPFGDRFIQYIRNMI